MHLRHSGASEITVMGFCLGGTIAAIYAAIADEPIKNLILSVTPVDFSASEFFDQWQEALKEGTADFDETIDIYQTIPASAVKYGNQVNNIARLFITLFIFIESSG